MERTVRLKESSRLPSIKDSMLSRLISVLAAAVVTFLLGSLNAFAASSNDACGGLQTAKPSELLALMDNAFSDDLLAPGINCTSEKLEHEPELCDLKTTVSMDRDLGNGRRLIVASTVNPGAKAGESHRDDIFVYACVDGQIMQVLQYGSERSVTVESAEAEKITLHSSYQVEGNAHADRVSFVWDNKLQYYLEQGTSFDVEPSKAPRLPCDGLKSADPNRLLATVIQVSGNWHGPGCYPDAKDCQWKASIDDDRMLGSGRRFIEVGQEQTGKSAVFGEVYIFGCVGGQVRALFNTRVEYGADVESASADTLILAVAKRAADDEEDAAPSLQELMTFSWNRTLNSYLLSSVHFRPSPPDEEQ